MYSDSSMSTTSIGQKTSFLIVNYVGYEHSGTYTCRATNSAGSTTYSAELKVNGSHWVTCLKALEKNSQMKNKFTSEY